MGQSLTMAATYLIQTLFSLYTLAIVLRFLLQIARADFYNPVSQAVIKVTNPALRPLRRMIPGFGGIDLSAVFLALVVQTAAICLILLLHDYSVPNFLQVIGWSAVGLLALTLNIYFFALIIVIVLSWVAPHTHNPLALLIHQLCEPVMGPARRLIPPIGGLDLSPIFIFIAINLAKMLIVIPLAKALYMPQGLVLGI